MTYTTPTPAELRLRWPAFASATDFPDSVVQAALDSAAAELAQDVWCATWTPGVLALAAHSLEIYARTLAAGAGNAGQGGIAAIKTGDEQITFGAVGAAIATGDEAALRTTPYGLEFLRLQETRVVTPFFVVI